MRLPVCVLLLSALTASAQWPLLETGASPDSPEKQAAFGAALARSFRQNTTPLDSPAALDYVRRLGAKVAAQLPEPRANFTFELIKSDSCGGLHEPCSFPGGHIFVPASLFLAAQDEAEFAAMLAHAMAYVQADLQERSATALPAGWNGFGGPLESQAFVSALQLQAQRSNQRRADLLAVKFTSTAGYDPQALVGYFTRVWQLESTPPIALRAAGKKYLTAFYDSRDTRIANIQSAIQALPPVNPGGEFLDIQDQVRSLSTN
jgi:beta-barrel assembly-enhancing protease